MSKRNTRKSRHILSVSESTDFDSDRYETIGVLGHEVGAFAFFRSKSYIDNYLKNDFIEKVLKQFPKASRIVGYKVIHKPKTTKIQHISKVDFKDKTTYKIPGAPINLGIPFLYTVTTPEKYILSGTVLSEKSSSKSRSHSRSHTRSRNRYTR